MSTRRFAMQNSTQMPIKGVSFKLYWHPLGCRPQQPAGRTSWRPAVSAPARRGGSGAESAFRRGETGQGLSTPSNTHLPRLAASKRRGVQAWHLATPDRVEPHQRVLRRRKPAPFTPSARRRRCRMGGARPRPARLLPCSGPPPPPAEGCDPARHGS